MRRVAFDCETHLIQPGQLFPKLVCVSISDGVTHALYNAADGLAQVQALLKDPEVILVGQNIAYDLGVIAAEAGDQATLDLIFQAYEACRIADTMIRAMLIAIAEGSFQEIDGQRRGKQFSLDMLALRWLDLKIQKEDTWRLHYAALEHTPLEEWPPDASDYSILDSKVTWLVDDKISAYVIAEGNPSGEIPDEHRQVKAAWALHLAAGWGVRIDEEMVKLVRENLEAQRTITHKTLAEWGIFKKDRNGNYKRTKKGALQKDQKRLRQLIAEGYQAQGESPPLTPKGQIATSADAARDSGNVAAIAYADGASAEKLLNTFVPILERGKSGLPITSAPNVLVASGRTSWTNPNWQNPPRVGGIRECVVARPGMVFCAADLDTVELRALAQSCLEMLGWSEMANALQRGDDLHLSLAAEILGIDYATAKALYDSGDPTVNDARQTAKAPNFGFPGGMGAKKFAINQIALGQPLISDPNATFNDHFNRASFLREAWFKRWPEMRHFLRNAGDVTSDFGPCSIAQPWSGRIRGGLDYCSCANSYFQGRVADGAKLALWRLAWACYVDKSSVLFGSRLVLFLHDEVILEVPEACADECSREIVRILCGAVQEVIPDIPITSAAVLTRRWWKGAKPLRVNGKLVPCKPYKDPTGKTKWVEDVKQG